MKCIYTGARIWIEEENAVFAADLYEVAPFTVVVRFIPESRVTCFTGEAAEALGATHKASMPEGNGMDWLRNDLGVLVTGIGFIEGELIRGQ